MDDKFGGNSTTYSKYHLPVKEKLRFVYHSPSGQQQRITVTYHFNEDFPSAIENNLLRDPEFSKLSRKEEILVPIYTAQIHASQEQLYSTVTGFELKTVDSDGTLKWSLFEDTDEIIRRVPINDIPATIPRVPFSALADLERLDGVVYTVSYRGERYAFKAHRSVFQDRLFSTELKARVQLGNIPHVANLVAVVMHDEFYVGGMLLKYCSQADLKFVLQRKEAEWSQKMKWAAQIAHGIIEIQKKGVMHGDLRCENVVIDEADNSYIIDIVDGQGGMEGWTSILDANTDPRRDVYGFGATLWEIARDGESPSYPLAPLKNTHIDALVRECVVDDAEKRTNMNLVFDMLGGKRQCGCEF
jgi:serine/threonine protein kinase